MVSDNYRHPLSDIVKIQNLKNFECLMIKDYNKCKTTYFFFSV